MVVCCRITTHSSSVRARLEQDVVGDAQLADVVQHAAAAQGLSSAGDRPRARPSHGLVRQAAAVVAGVLVLGLDHARQREQGGLGAVELVHGPLALGRHPHPGRNSTGW
jgi:hypothetical protein